MGGSLEAETFQGKERASAAELRGRLPDLPSRDGRSRSTVTLQHPKFRNRVRDGRIYNRAAASKRLILTDFSFQVPKSQKRDQRVAQKVPLNPQQSSKRLSVYSVYFVSPVLTETT